MKIAFTFIVWLFFINLNAQPSLSDSAINYKMYKAQQYYTGVGESKSLQTAFELYAECARQGYPQAMTMLGTMYIKGQGVKAGLCNEPI